MILEPSKENLKPLPWHEKFIQARLKKGLPQALLIQGRRDDGLDQLCLSLASMTIAEQDKVNKDLIEAGTHPDLHYITQHINEKTKKVHHDIAIDDIREKVFEKVFVTPSHADHRICIITPACHMNRKSASALLKILEEPQSHLKFILGCTNIALLPATIKSRCVKLLAPRPSIKQTKKYLSDNKVKTSEAILAINNYAPFTSIKHKNLDATYNKFLNYCIDPVKLTTIVKEFEDKEESIEINIWISWAMTWVAQAIRMNLNLPCTDEYLQLETKKVIKSKTSNIQLLKIFDELLYIENISRYELNKRLLLERVCNIFLKLNNNAY